MRASEKAQRVKEVVTKHDSLSLTHMIRRKPVNTMAHVLAYSVNKCLIKSNGVTKVFWVYNLIYLFEHYNLMGLCHVQSGFFWPMYSLVRGSICLVSVHSALSFFHYCIPLMS